MEPWLDRNEYPFESKFFDLPMGRMHYLDEGPSTHAVVMVHGNPAWSFTYRKLIKCLSEEYRCIVPDHIGFGLSDKPTAWESGNPYSLAQKCTTMTQRAISFRKSWVRKCADW